MKSQPSHDQSPPIRLRDEPGAARAGHLLRTLGEPTPLSRTQLADVAARLEESIQPPRWRFRAAWAFAGASFAALVAIVLPRLAHQPPTVAAELEQALSIPAGVTATLHGADGEVITAFGPVRGTTARGASPEELLSLVEGRVVVRTGAREARFQAAGRRVTISRGALIEVIAQRVSVRVAAYEGSARVAVGTLEHALDIPRGAVLEGDRVQPLKAGPPADVAALLSPTAALAPPSIAPAPAAPAPRVDAPLPVVAHAEPAARPMPAAPPRSAHHHARPGAAPAASIARLEAPEPGPAEAPAVAIPRPSAAPAPTVSAAPAAPPAVAPAAAAPAESPLAIESRLLSGALRQLRGGDPAAALRTLDDYQRRFPAGGLWPESRRARVEALLALDRRRPALEVLDQMGAELGNGELRVARGELRAELRRERAAIQDFDAALPYVDGPVAERALYGRASARSRAHDDAGARADLEAYARRFPKGRFIGAVRRALER